eukprot:13673540-Alexandrium_andersonii.AAC.1
MLQSSRHRLHRASRTVHRTTMQEIIRKRKNSAGTERGERYGLTTGMHLLWHEWVVSAAFYI